MIFGFPNISFSDREWEYIICKVLKGWTEIPLNSVWGYDIDTVRFYDAIIGTLLKHTETMVSENEPELNHDFINSWKYQGKIYRVLHPCPKRRGSARTKLPKVDYNGLIAHWTTDYTFRGLMHKLSKREKYVILEADTNEHFGFDVNKYRQTKGLSLGHTGKENEIIFPMYKECVIKEYKMTIEEFVKMKQEDKN